MKKFKDILYDYNDIIIAFLILVIAALLIIWRMNAIIEYPKTLVGDDTPSVSEPSDNNSTGEQGGEQNQPSNNDSPSAESGELWVDGALSRTVEVSVSGDSASEAVQCLIDAQLFKDYAEYQSACDGLGIDHQKVSAGTFKFEKGTTKKDIARAINWG